MMVDVKFIPCPFCGHGDINVTVARENGIDITSVWCDKCGARVSSTVEKKAFDKWNRRNPESEAIDLALFERCNARVPIYCERRGAICPSCNEELYVRAIHCAQNRCDSIEIKEQPPFCKWCGQRLVWGEEVGIYVSNKTDKEASACW